MSAADRSAPNESDAGNGVRADLREVPASARLVYLVLEHEGPMTQGEIADASLLPPRTVRYALARLREVNAVTGEIFLPDARRTRYTPTTP